MTPSLYRSHLVFGETTKSTARPSMQPTRHLIKPTLAG